MEEEMKLLYASSEWQKATPEQRQAFVAKVRADERIKREVLKLLNRRQQKAERIERRREKRQAKKAEAKKSAPFKTAKKTKRLPRPVTSVTVGGVDVSSREFLETYQWRQVRMKALIKYGRKCACCGATPETGAVMNVDHIKPRKLFPNLALELSNLQVLCHECNHGKGNWDQTDWRESVNKTQEI